MTEIHHSEIFIDAPRARVFRFFVDPDWLPRWLGVAAELDPRPGGRFRFEVTRGEWCVGEYVHVDPPRKVSFTWGWENEVMSLPPGSSLVEVEFAVEGEGTRVMLTHSGLTDHDSLALHAEGWSRYLNRLDLVARDLDPGPDPAAEGPETARRRLETQ